MSSKYKTYLGEWSVWFESGKKPSSESVIGPLLPQGELITMFRVLLQLWPKLITKVIERPTSGSFSFSNILKIYSYDIQKTDRDMEWSSVIKFDITPEEWNNGVINKLSGVESVIFFQFATKVCWYDLMRLNSLKEALFAFKTLQAQKSDEYVWCRQIYVNTIGLIRKHHETDRFILNLPEYGIKDESFANYNVAEYVIRLVDNVCPNNLF